MSTIASEMYRWLRCILHLLATFDCFVHASNNSASQGGTPAIFYEIGNHMVWYKDLASSLIVLPRLIDDGGLDHSSTVVHEQGSSGSYDTLTSSPASSQPGARSRISYR